MCHVYHLSNACGPSPGSDCACRFYRIRMILVKVLHICVFCSDRCKVMQHNIDDGSLTGRWIHSNHHIGLTQHFCPGLSGSEMESSVDVSAVPDASGADLGYQRRALWVAWSKSRMTWCDMHWYMQHEHPDVGQGAWDQSSTPSTSSITASCRCKWRRPMLAEFGGVFLAISLVICDDIVSLVEMSCTICTFATMWRTTCRLWEFAGQRAIAWQGLGRLGAALQPYRTLQVLQRSKTLKKFRSQPRSSGRLAAPGESMERRERFWISRCRWWNWSVQSSGQFGV